MINRRQAIVGAGAAMAGTMALSAARAAASPCAPPASEVNQLDPLKTMIRLRSRTDGALSMAWLDAQREIFIDGNLTPFCKLNTLVLTKCKQVGEVAVLNTIELTYYCDPVTGELQEQVTMPGASEPVDVPIYRSGPSNITFNRTMDAWEHNDPHQGGASAAFAPVSWVHLVRGIRDPWVAGGSLYLRADEYGRVYPDRSKPPPIYYRESIVWKAQSDAVLASDAPDVPSDYSYSAVSSFRPWMKMGDTQGHTVSNGRGQKVSAPDQLPEQLVKLLAAHDPKALDDPESLFA